MACLSNEYLTDNKKSADGKKKEQTAMFRALVYSTSGTDLTALLIANETGVEKLPIITLAEAKA